MKNLKALVCLIFILSVGIHSEAQTCSELFRNQDFFQSLTEKNTVTETEILRAAEKDILGYSNISSRAKSWARNVFAVVNLRKNLRTQSEIELRRRTYRNMLSDMGVPIVSDYNFFLYKYKPYIQAAFALAANGAVNYLTYRYLSQVGFLVYIPQVRFFNPRDIPNDVLVELASTNLEDDAPRTRAYVFANIKYGAQKVYDSIRNIVYAGVISTFVITHADLITDPTSHTLHEMDRASLVLNRESYKSNLETLKALGKKKLILEKAGQVDAAAQIDSAIIGLTQTNSQILAEIQK